MTKSKIIGAIFLKSKYDENLINEISRDIKLRPKKMVEGKNYIFVNYFNINDYINKEVIDYPKAYFKFITGTRKKRQRKK